MVSWFARNPAVAVPFCAPVVPRAVIVWQSDPARIIRQRGFLMAGAAQPLSFPLFRQP